MLKFVRTTVVLALSFVGGVGAAHAQAAAAVAPSMAPTPPLAAQHPYQVTSPSGSRNDEYYWLRDDTRKNSEMLAYLKAENSYTEAMMAHTQASQDLLYKEMVGRIKQDDSTVPALKDGYWYGTRFAEGKEYPIYVRHKGSLEAPEEVILDANALATGHGYFQVAGLEESKDGRLLGYAEDTVGRRQYNLRIKDLSTGAMLPDTLSNIEADLAWSNDGRTILYVEKDPVTLLGYKIRKHALGTDPQSDPVVYEEKDHSFYVNVSKTPSDHFLKISLHSTVASEEWFANADDSALAFHVVLPRKVDHEYEAVDLGSDYILRTNRQAKNFRIVRVPMEKVADSDAWKDVLPARADAFVDDFSALRDYLVVSERSGGLRKLRTLRWKDGVQSVVSAQEPTYVMRLGTNLQQDTSVVRYIYTSLTTPATTYDLDLATGAKKELKRDAVLGGFDPSHYVSELVWAVVRDGAKVPVSLVHLKSFKRDGTGAMLQYGYGSYGLSSDPGFNNNILSLVDRGFVYAVAHIRGGQEMGRSWYDDGKLLHKKNTFNDFVDVTKYLVTQRYAAKDKVFAQGGSAGGLLMGAVVNQCPSCYRGVIAQVPFVDVVTTMLDESIPLTTGEFDEWGNPKNKPYYDYMLSYSPYDNVTRQKYPAMLVTTGLWDSQVQYYEPTKWVARLRARKTDQNPLIFKVNMEAGHGGRSGRFERLHDTAMVYAFIFDQVGRDVATEDKSLGR
jgi:oligopeptidase B